MATTEQPDPPVGTNPLVWAVQEFYAKRNNGVTPDRAEVVAHVKHWTGREDEMWRYMLDQNGIEYTDEVIANTLEAYPNTYNLKKKSVQGVGGSSGDATAADKTYSTTDGVPTPLVRPATNLTPEQQFAQRVVYGTTEGDYQPLYAAADRKYQARIRALDRREKQGDLSAEEAKRRKDEALAEQAAEITRLKTLAKAGAPGAVAAETDEPVAASLAPSVFQEVADKYGNLPLQEAFDMLNAQLPEMLGTTPQEANELYNKLVNWQDDQKGFTWSDKHPFAGRRIDGESYLIMHPNRLNRMILERGRAAVEERYPNIPESFYEAYETNTLPRDYAYVADLSRSDNTFGRMADQMATEYVDANMQNLSDAERQRARRQVRDVIKTSYRYKAARTEASNAMGGSPAANMQAFQQRVQNLDNMLAAQYGELEQRAQAELQAVESEGREQLMAAQESMRKQGQAYHRRLQAQIESGRLSEEAAAMELAEYQNQLREQYRTQANRVYTELSQRGGAYRRQVEQMLSEHRKQVAELAGQLGLEEGEQGYGLDPEFMAEYQALTESYLADQAADEYRRGQDEYAGLTYKEKISRGFDKGVYDLLNSAGMSLSWLGADEIGQDLSFFAQERVDELPLKDFGQFEWSNTLDPDWWASKVTPTLPLALTFMAGGGVVGAGARGTATAIGAGGLAATVAEITTAGIGMRLMESTVEGAQRYQTSLDQGKTPEQAAADARKVVGDTALLFGLDALQYGLAFAPPIFRIGQTASKATNIALRGASTVGATGVAIGTEAFEEAWVGYANHRIDDPSSNFIDYLQSPEGKEQAVLGGLLGFGFHLTGSLVPRDAHQQVTTRNLQEIIESEASAAQISSALDQRALELGSGIAILRDRGVISEQQAEQAALDLEAQHSDYKLLLAGELPVKPEDGPRAYQYMALRAQARGLEQSVDSATDKAVKENYARELRTVRDRMDELSKGEGALYSVDGIPMNANTLHQLVTNPEVARALKAEQIEITGDPLQEAMTFSRLAETEGFGAGPSGLFGEVDQAVQRTENAILQLAEDLDNPGDLRALAEKAARHDAIDNSSDRTKWQAVTRVLREVAAGQDTLYQRLRETWQAQETEGGTPDMVTPQDQVELSAAPSNPDARNAEAAVASALDWRNEAALESEYQQTVANEGRRAAIAKADPVLAQRIERGDNLTAQDKAKAIYYGQGTTAQETGPQAEAAEAAPDTEGDDVAPLRADVAEELDLALANRPSLRRELESRNPALAARLADSAVSDLTPSEQRQVQRFVRDMEGRALADPELYVEQYDEGAQNFINRTLAIVKERLKAMGGAPVGIVPRFMQGRRSETQLAELQKFTDERLRLHEMSDLMTGLAEAVMSMGGQTYLDFQAALEADPDLNLDQLDESFLRASWDKAKAQVELRAKDPVNFYSQLGTFDALRQVFQDTRRGLKVLMDKVRDNPALNFATDANGNPISPYEAFELLVSRVAHRVDELHKKIIGVDPGTLGARRINQRSFVGRWEAETNTSVKTFSMLAYAAHAKEFNMVARQRIQARKDAALNKLNASRDSLDKKIAKAEADGDRKAAKALTAERADITAEIDRILSGAANEYFLPDNPSGMSDAEADGILEEVGETVIAAETTVDGQGSQTTLRDAFDKFYAEFKRDVIDARIELMRDEGLITAEAAENLLLGRRPVGIDENGDTIYEEGFQYYIPLRVDSAERVAFEGAIVRTPGVSNDAAAVQEIVGTYRYDVLSRQDPFATAIAQYEATAAKVERNRAMRQLADLIKHLRDPQLGQVIPSSARVTMAEDGEMITQRDTTSANIRENSEPVHINGKLFYVYFRPVKNKKNQSRPHPVLQALREDGKLSLQTDSAILNKLVSALRWYVGLKRSVITTFNPFFAPINFMRDFQETMLNLASVPRLTPEQMKGLRTSVASNIPAAIRALTKYGFSGTHADTGARKMSQYLRDAYEDGMPVSWAHYADPSEKIAKVEEVFKKQKRLGFREGLAQTAAADLRNMWNLAGSSVQMMNDVMENSMRLSTYAALRDRGVDRQSAAAAAKNIALNFEKKGTFGPLINALFLFSNAGIQGTARGLANLKTPAGRKGLAGLVFAGMAFAAWREFYEDEEELDALTDSFTRSNYLIIPIPGSRKPLTIPKAYGPGRVFVNLGENLYRAVTGKDNLYGFMRSMLIDNVAPLVDPIGGASANPVSAWSPTIVTVPVEYLTNQNFTGSKWYYASKYADLQERVAYQQPEIIAQMTGWLNDNLGLNVPPVLVWMYYKELTGGIGAEGANIYRLATDPDAQATPLNYTPLARRLAMDLDGADYKALSNLDELLSRSVSLNKKLGGLSEGEIERAKRAFKILRERGAYSNRKLSELLKTFYEKYEIDLRR